jgi:hypothetical protein
MHVEIKRMFEESLGKFIKRLERFLNHIRLLNLDVEINLSLY